MVGGLPISPSNDAGISPTRAGAHNCGEGLGAVRAPSPMGSPPGAPQEPSVLDVLFAPRPVARPRVRIPRPEPQAHSSAPTAPKAQLDSPSVNGAPKINGTSDASELLRPVPRHPIRRRVIADDSDEEPVKGDLGTHKRPAPKAPSKSRRVPSDSSSESNSNSDSDSDSDSSSDGSSSSGSTSDSSSSSSSRSAATIAESRGRPKPKAKAKARARSTARSPRKTPPRKMQKKEIESSGESGDDDDEDDDLVGGRVTTSRAAQRDPTAQLIAKILCRWWYVLPPWPPEDYDWDAALEARKLKAVKLEQWEMADDVDERGFVKVYPVSHYKGVYRDPQGNAIDLRPLELKPCFATLHGKKESELYAMLVTALRNQLKALDKSPYRATEGAALQRLRRDLEHELKLAEDNLEKIERRQQYLDSKATSTQIDKVSPQ